MLLYNKFMNSPKNKLLYNKIKNLAKRKFKAWPSAYASGWLVKEYLKAGGEYEYNKKKSSNLNRWYKEKWVNVCKLPKLVSCGREKYSKKKYPYCRPSIRINKKTPKTIHEISKKILKRRCSNKRKNPKKKIMK